MNTPDLSTTTVVLKFGPRGARLYGGIWFAALYSMLTASTAALCILSPEFSHTWRRVLFGSIVAVLVVVAASVLTQMHVKFFAGIKQLEASRGQHERINSNGRTDQ